MTFVSSLASREGERIWRRHKMRKGKEGRSCRNEAKRRKKVKEDGENRKMEVGQRVRSEVRKKEWKIRREKGNKKKEKENLDRKRRKVRLTKERKEEKQ